MRNKTEYKVGLFKHQDEACETIQHPESINVFGKNIPVYREGNPNGKPLLVLGPADLFRKRELLKSIEPSFNILYVDIFSSKGEEIAYEDLTLENFIEATHEIINKLGLTQCSLFAHSGLSTLGLAYTDQYPDRVQTCYIVSGAPFWGQEKDKESSRYFNANAEAARKDFFKQKATEENSCKTSFEIFSAGYDRRRALFFNRYASEDTQQWLGVLSNPDIDLINTYFRLIPNFDINETNLKSVPQKIKVILGLRDFSLPFFLWTETDGLSSKDDNSKPVFPTYIIPDADHYPMLSTPEEFAAQMTQDDQPHNERGTLSLSFSSPF